MQTPCFNFKTSTKNFSQAYCFWQDAYIKLQLSVTMTNTPANVLQGHITWQTKTRNWGKIIQTHLCLMFMVHTKFQCNPLKLVEVACSTNFETLSNQSDVDSYTSPSNFGSGGIVTVLQSERRTQISSQRTWQPIYTQSRVYNK